MPKPKSKLYRNLKPGDKFQIFDDLTPGKRRSFTVVVTGVRETSRGLFSGRRQWVVEGQYPWWWSVPVHAYSNERTELVQGEQQ